MHVVEVEVTTDASGDFVTDVRAPGVLRSVVVGQNTFANGADLEVSDLVSSDKAVDVTDINDARGKTFHPRVPVVDANGSVIEAEYTAPVIVDQARIRVGSGGNAKSGVIYLCLD